MSTTNSLPNASSHFIAKSTAVAMTTLYRANRETILEQSMKGQDILPLNETFNRQAIDDLLAQEGCAGIRIYYGMDSNEQIHAILVGVNEANEDLVSSGESLDDTGDDIIVEVGQRCPPACPPPSDLNG